MLGAVVSMLARYGFTIILIDYVLSFGKGDDVFLSSPLFWLVSLLGAWFVAEVARYDYLKNPSLIPVKTPF